MGTPGTGKTYTAVLALLFGAMIQRSVLYANVPRLMDDLRPSQNDEGKALMRRCSEADILVLDDLGQEKSSEWVMERLYIIINERYLAQKTTVITSNYSLSELEARIKHSAIVSRIRGFSIDVDFTGEDQRKAITI